MKARKQQINFLDYELESDYWGAIGYFYCARFFSFITKMGKNRILFLVSYLEQASLHLLLAHFKFIFDALTLLCWQLANDVISAIWKRGKKRTTHEKLWNYRKIIKNEEQILICFSSSYYSDRHIEVLKCPLKPMKMPWKHPNCPPKTNQLQWNNKKNRYFHNW